MIKVEWGTDKVLLLANSPEEVTKDKICEYYCGGVAANFYKYNDAEIARMNNLSVNESLRYHYRDGVIRIIQHPQYDHDGTLLPGSVTTDQRVETFTGTAF